MELPTRFRQQRQAAMPERGVAMIENNYSQREVFSLFRWLELHCQKVGIVCNIYLHTTPKFEDQSVAVVVEPIDEDPQTLDRLLAMRPSFEAVVERAQVVPFCPVLAPEDAIDYPADWLRDILPALPAVTGLAQRHFDSSAAEVLEVNSEYEPSPNLLGFAVADGSILHVNLQACSTYDNFEAQYNLFLQQALTVLRDFWRIGTARMTPEEALRWQCRAIGGELYQLQSPRGTPFLLDRLQGLPALLWVRANKVAKHRVAEVLQPYQKEVTFFRDYVQIEMRTWRDFDLPEEVAREALAVRGRVRLTRDPGPGALAYSELGQGPVYSTLQV